MSSRLVGSATLVAAVGVEDNETLTELNYIERKFLNENEAPITTVTWFEGSHLEATAVIRQRLGKIMSANPWLGGTLVKKKSKNYIHFATTPDATAGDIVEKFLLTVAPQDSVIHHEMDFSEVQELGKSAGYYLAAGNTFQKPFWRIAVVPSSRTAPKERFAVFLSLTHVVGDGHTYYTLFNMLMNAGPIQALDARRVANAQQKHEMVLGTKESQAMTSIGQLWCALKGLWLTYVYGPLFFSTRYQAKSHYFLIDSSKMDQFKKEGASDDAFVSTNDVLTSWFFQNAGFPIGFMAVNLRGRVPEFREDLAGNYENVLTYRVPQDVDSPSSIRKSVQHLKRDVTYGEELKDSEYTTGVGVATNWSTFMSHNNIDLAGCRPLLHLPFFDTAMMPATYGLCIIFRAAPGKLAVLLAATEEHLCKLLKSASLFAADDWSPPGMTMSFSIPTSRSFET